MFAPALKNCSELVAKVEVENHMIKLHSFIKTDEHNEENSVSLDDLLKMFTIPDPLPLGSYLKLEDGNEVKFDFKALDDITAQVLLLSSGMVPEDLIGGFLCNSGKINKILFFPIMHSIKIFIRYKN